MLPPFGHATPECGPASSGVDDMPGSCKGAGVMWIEIYVGRWALS